MKRLFTLALAMALNVVIVTTTSAVSVDYTSVANGTYGSISLGGTTVTGSSTVTSGTLGSFRGLGVTGGGDNLSLDTGETMTIALGQLGANVQLTFVDIDPVGNVPFSFQAFNGATSLGIFACPLASTAPQTYNLSTIAGGLSMSSFIISVQAPGVPKGLQIQAVSFDAAVPDSTSTLALLGLGIVGLFSFRTAFQRQNCCIAVSPVRSCRHGRTNLC
jgi:hypothetical protein